MCTALVLGAGGLVGIAHHVGALAALEEELGLGDPSFDLVVGTSAGSVAAAYLRSGWSARRLFDRMGGLAAAAPAPAATSPLQLLRHLVGSGYVIARSTIRLPSLLSIVPGPGLRRAFPAGVASMAGGLALLEGELPRGWPARPLWLASYDLVARRRVVLKGANPYLPLPQAVQASCAIPGAFPPVQVAGKVLVDGGAWSLTNLDLAAAGGARRVVCVAPMSYDRLDPPDRANRAVREVATRLLERQASRLRRQGVEVLVLAPGRREVRVQGINLMRSSGLAEVAEVAYLETRRRLCSLEHKERWRLGPAA